MAIKYTVLGVNSGIGVSLYPFLKQTIGAIEVRQIFHTPGNPQWKANFGHIPFEKDENNFYHERVDVIISSPDCGSGSVLRYSRAKKLGNHKENQSLLVFFDKVIHHSPKFFLFENLAGLFKSFPEADFDELLKDYKLIKYHEPVSAWGNSQKHRKRLVIVGIRRDLKGLKKCFKLPEETEIKTCKEIYGDLKSEDLSIGHVREPIESIIAMYSGKKLSLAKIQQRWLKYPKAKRWKVKDRKFANAPGVYRNLDSSCPATARKANRQFDQDGLTLTPRQLARVQGVPDEFVLYMESTKPQYWINKARAVVTKTPPMEISIWFKQCLNKAFKIIENDNTPS